MNGVQTGMISELVKYRELFLSLTLREIRIRYKQSILGVLWALFMPLSMMLIFTFVFTRAVKLSDVVSIDMPYPIFAYIGLLPWTYFASSLTQSVNALVANRQLVTKIYCPREMFVFSVVGSAFFDFLIAGVVLLGLIGYFHWFTDWTFHLHWSILFVPVIVLVQTLFTLACGLLLAMANLFFRDVRFIATVAIQLWMFVTNVIYPLESGDRLVNFVINANPMTPIISGYRDCIVGGTLPSPHLFVPATVVSIVSFVVAWAWFHASEFKFAESI